MQAVLAYRAVAAAIGPVGARRLLRAAHDHPPTQLRALLDAAHARLHTERRDVALAKEAAAAIAAEPIDEPRPSDAMGIAELAGALGVRTSTLRHWDAEGLVVPGRSPGGARTYAPGDVRDGRIVSPLRRAGYRIGALRVLVPELRRAPRWDEVVSTPAARDADARSHALLRGGALLDALLARCPVRGTTERRRGDRPTRPATAPRAARPAWRPRPAGRAAPPAHFERLGPGRFRATRHTGGAWAVAEQHISPLDGLLVHVLDRFVAARAAASDAGADGLATARITFEILGVVPIGEVDVSVEVVRPGRTIELLEAVAVSGGRAVLRARAWRLARFDTR